MKAKTGMRIRTRIASLVTILICAVITGIAATLIWVQQRQLREDFSSRTDAMMNGVERIAGESLKSGDEIMLLSYLKHLMKECAEFELALVSRAGYTSVLGEVRTELYYRTITVAGDKSPVTSHQLPVTSKNEPRTANSIARLPPGTLVVQIGLSKTVLERQIRQARVSMIAKVLGIAGIGLLLGFLGSWWVSRRLAGPIVALTADIQGVAEGKRPENTEVSGDEIAYLRKQYGNMTARITEFIRFKEELLMTLTHELNNPLVGLKGLIGLLMDSSARPSPREADESYKIMSEAVSAMELSLSNALELFKMGARPALKPERVRLNDLVSQVLRLFRPMAQFNHINLQEPALPAPVYLDADEELLRRVIINLVSNACKYTQPGGSVKLNVEDSAGRVGISVSDTGPGIAPEDRELIFTRFYRVPGPDGKSRRIPGTGLGLAIARAAVELHNGRIWVESEKGRGSVFHVSLPKNRDQKSEVGGQKAM